MTYVYLGIMLVVFFLVTVIPQRKRQKQLQQIRESLKVGMKVRTAGGFLGTIILVTEETVMLECGPNKVQLEILKGAVAPADEAPLPEEVTAADPVEALPESEQSVPEEKEVPSEKPAEEN